MFIYDTPCAYCLDQLAIEVKHWLVILQQGVKLIFFSDSHLAPKFFKVVANSKKVGRHFQRQTKPFFLYIVIVLEIRLGKRSLMCYKMDTRMDDIQCSSAPKSKMASSYWSRCMSCIFETNLTWNLLWFIFPNRFNSLYHLVRLWWNILVANLVTNFQYLVAKVKKSSCIGTCIKRNFMSCTGI